MISNTSDIRTIVENVLRISGAWRRGHFLLSSGLHSDQYVQCQRVMQYPRLGALLADMLAVRLDSENIRPDIVLGPALGAVHWALFTAGALERFRFEKDNNGADGSNYFLSADSGIGEIAGEILENMIPAVFAERAPGSDDFSIRRGIELPPGAKVLVVEDVTTTGGSARKVVDLVRKLGAEPVAVGAIADRSGGRASFDVPFISLIRMELETYEPGECPMCRSGSKAEKPGSSRVS